MLDDEDKDYTNLVRKSLLNKKQHKKANYSSGQSKIKVNFNEYKSENVFLQTTKSEVSQKKKQTQINKIKSNKSGNPNFDYNSTITKSPLKMSDIVPSKVKSKKPLLLSAKKTRIVSDLNTDLMSPSKSEIEYIPFLAKNDPIKKVTKEPNFINVSNGDDDSNLSFDFSSFFNSSEPCMNESTSVQYSSLNCKILSEDMKNASINSSQIYSNSEDENKLSTTDVNTEQMPYKPNTRPKKSTNSIDSSFQSNVSIDNCRSQPGNSAPKSCAKYYTEGNEKFVKLKKNCSISVFGVFDLKVIRGKIEVLGYILDELSKEITLYSPRGTALLNVQNIANDDCILKYTAVKDSGLPFVEKHIAQQIFPHAVANLPRVSFEPKDISNVIIVDDSWQNILECVNYSTKLLVTGGKRVGKSTFLKYALNKLLNRFEKVRIIDLDSGQSEFAVPGCVSIFTITEPIFGPNYTHLMKPERSYVSNINIGHDPLAYIKCIHMLVKYLQTLDDIPTLINYMGFVQGIGLNILSSVITYLKPTVVVQIVSKNKNKNFQIDLSVPVVIKHCNLFGYYSKNVDFKVYKIKAMNDEKEGWTLAARQARELCVLAYFAKIMTENVCSLSSHLLPMYEINLESIKLVNLQGLELPPAAVNGNLVVLCCIENNSEIFSCFGYGVVRGIDLNTHTLILLTPEDQSVLDNVSHLVLGSVMLPPAVYMTPNCITGNIPYVMEGELVSLAQITRRTYLPANKNKN